MVSIILFKTLYLISNFIYSETSKLLHEINEEQIEFILQVFPRRAARGQSAYKNQVKKNQLDREENLND